jgi:hypothetical protein
MGQDKAFEEVCENLCPDKCILQAVEQHSQARGQDGKPNHSGRKVLRPKAREVVRKPLHKPGLRCSLNWHGELTKEEFE